MDELTNLLETFRGLAAEERPDVGAIGTGISVLLLNLTFRLPHPEKLILGSIDREIRTLFGKLAAQLPVDD